MNRILRHAPPCAVLLTAALVGIPAAVAQQETSGSWPHYGGANGSTRYSGLDWLAVAGSEPSTSDAEPSAGAGAGARP